MTAPGSLSHRQFGFTADRQEAALYTLRNSRGMEAKITNYGGSVVSLTAPDRTGTMADVVLGHDQIEEYLQSPHYFGALIGRAANRIREGRFSIDGKTHQLSQNNPPHSLHGGCKGFDKALWLARPHQDGGNPCLELNYLSSDGEEGFPGNLAVSALYMLTDQNELRLDFRATTDRPTIVNLTHHSYFNLAGNGCGDILGHEIEINADHFIPVDSGLIPTGELRAVAGTPFDFRKTTSIGNRINEAHDQLIRGHGYDHTFVINKPPDELALAATVFEPRSGRILQVHSTAPGLQFYTGNFLESGSRGKNWAHYGPRHGFCLEPQHFPDAPNHPHFPQIIFRPGDVYTHTIIYSFETD